MSLLPVCLQWAKCEVGLKVKMVKSQEFPELQFLLNKYTVPSHAEYLLDLWISPKTWKQDNFPPSRFGWSLWIGKHFQLVKKYHCSCACHEGVWGNRNITPFILNSDVAWSDSSTSCTYYSPPPPWKNPAAPIGYEDRWAPKASLDDALA